MSQAAIAECKLILAILFAGALVLQVVLLPLMGADVVAHYPEVHHLRPPITVLAVLAVACGEVVLLCTWRLLTLVGQNRIRSRPAFRCLDIMVVSLLAGAGLMAAILNIITVADQGTGGPIPPLALLLGMTGSTVAALIVLAMRRRLTQEARAQRRRAGGI